MEEMMRKIILMLGIAVMSFAMTACESKNNTEENNSNDIIEEEKDHAKELNNIKEAVKTSFEDNYVPSMPIEETMLKELYGLDPTWYDAIEAEVAMMSTHVDTYIGLHPTEGNKDNILEALNKYKDYLVSDSLQYPMNMEKVKAATILEEGDYIYFIMLGVINDDITDESERLAAFEEQNQKAIDVIRTYGKEIESE